MRKHNKSRIENLLGEYMQKQICALRNQRNELGRKSRDRFIG